MRYALPLCVAASLAAHLLVLNVRVPREAPRQAAHPPAGPAKTIQVRLLPGVKAVAPAEILDVGPVAKAAEQSAPAPAPEAAAAQTPAPSAPATESAAPSSSIVAPAAESDHDEYVPRPLLTVAPFARAPVVIAPPPGETAIGRHQGILSLFIDEEGRVQHISPDKNSPLPPAFEQAAREAFLAARFAPGQIDGRVVKARVRVEVVFDNTPLPEAAPAPGR